MIASDFFYNFPRAVYLIFFTIPFFLCFYALFSYRKKTLASFASQDLLSRTVYERPAVNYWRKVIFFMIVWILASLALMDPRGNAHYPETYMPLTPPKKLKQKPHEVIFLIDTSPSMAVQDMRGKESRIVYAKDVVDETIRRLRGQTVSLYTFTSETDKLVPPTLDLVYARLVSREVQVDETNAGGTDFLQAIRQLDNDYPLHPHEKLKTLIILSDGGDIAYELGSAQERKLREDLLLKAVGNTQIKNLKINTIGIGSQQGGEVPDILYHGKKVISKELPQLLQALANRGKGTYYDATQYSPTEIAENLLEQILKDDTFLNEYEVEQQVYLDKNGEDYVYDSYYQKILLMASILLAILLLFPENWKRETGL